MTLIKSISGIRGTIGGRTGDTLNPLDIVKFTTAYATYLKRQSKPNDSTRLPKVAYPAPWFATLCAEHSLAWDMKSST